MTRIEQLRADRCPEWTKLKFELTECTIMNPFSQTPPTTDSLETVQQHVATERAVLVDVREVIEWQQGAIAGAVLLPLSELGNGLDSKALAERLPVDRIVYTYCAAGVRSCIAADFLAPVGYDVRPLSPGYRDLIAAGFAAAPERDRA
jgi:phage shock protein E